MASKETILRVLELLNKEGLFTNTKTSMLVFDRFKNSTDPNEIIRFILTSGEAKGTMECSSCRKNLPADRFTYYQTRVDASGYLMRSNALCKNCSKKRNEERDKVLKENKRAIPPEPKRGSVCPNCKRKWIGKWHRHHDEKTKTFIDWLCGNCNMALQDQRNPKTKYGKR